MLIGERVQYYLAKFFPTHRLTHEKGYRVAIFHSIESSHNFEEIIKFLRDHCTIIRPDTGIENHKGQAGECPLVISFDDGLLSQFTEGLEVLEKYGIKGLFFIPTKILFLKSPEEEMDFAVKNIHFEVPKNLREYRFMKPEMIKELHDLGHVIGSHSVNHVRFNGIDLETAVYELEESRRHLNQLLGEDVKFFAFPKGDRKSVDPGILPLVNKFYTYGFSAIRGWNNENTPRCFLHRDPINLYYPFDFIERILQGSLDWYFSIKNRYFLLGKNACNL